MDFKVHLNDGSYETFEDDDRYDLNKAGLLVTRRGDEETTWSPYAWTRVVQTSSRRRGVIV